MSSTLVLSGPEQLALSQAPRKSGYPTPEQAQFKATTDKIARENAWMAAPVLAAAAAPLLVEGVPLAAAGTAAAARFIGRGGEWEFGPNLRIAPFGNRTGNPLGRFPHYHRREPLVGGKSAPGQGISRHRPWETKSADKSFWDRF